MPDSEHVTVVVTLTQKDYAAALRALAKNRRGWFQRVLFWLSIAFLGWMVFRLLQISDIPLLSGTLVAASVILFILVFWGLSRVVWWLAARSFVKKNPNKLGPAKHSIGPDGATYESAHGAGTTNWSAYQRILETKDLFLLYPQSNFAQILPKRCFENTGQMETYRQVLKTYYKGKLQLLS